METGSSSAIVIILWVLAANILLILAAYGLVLWLRSQTQAAMRQLGERIQEFAGRLDEIAGFLQEFVGIDQEPYSTHLDELQKEASELQKQIQAFLEEARQFEEESLSAGSNQLQEIINGPFNWFRRWRRSRVLLQESKALEERMASAETRVEQVYDLPWELAQQCRQVEKDLKELAQAAQGLQGKGVRGEGLKNVLTQLPLLQRSANEIPSEFFDADHEALIAAANLDSTIRVFEVLNRVRPALGRYLPQVREWDATYQKASGEFNELKQAGANLRQSMARPPEGLETSQLQERLDTIAQMAADLGQRLAQPEVESLKPLARDVSHLRRVIQDTEQQLSRASQQVSELNKALEELRDGLEKLAGQAGDLEKRELFPLAWDESNPRLGELRKRLQALGPVQQPRTPEQVTQHLKETQAIRGGHQAHAAAFPRISEQHRVLVDLLESPELREGAAWLRKAHETLNQTSAYDAHNWSKQDSLQTLPAELEELSHRHEQLVPLDRAAPVKESELAQRLKDTQALAALHKSLRPRVESITARLEKVRGMEKEGKEKLTESFNALERVALLAESNNLLAEIAIDEIDRLSEEIRVLGNELNAQGQGEVEKKLQKINAQAEKVNKSLNGWLGRLNAEISETGRLISGRLIELDAIAPLEDPPVADARAVLSRDEYLASQGAAPSPAPAAGGLRGVAARVAERGLQRPSLQSDLEATAEIKRKNDLWQTLQAVQKALVEKTEALLSAHQEMLQARTAAREGLAEVNKRIPERRSWPPANQSPLTEAQLLQPIDEKWEALKKQPRRVEQVILELGRLTQQYQLAAERARQLLERVDEDEERVQKLEEQLEEVKDRWQSQAQAAPANPVIREGVHQLMSQAESRLAYIKHQYMRGALSYEQALHNLQLLYDEIYSARVSIDDQNDIGLNETHHHAHPASS